MGQQLDCTCSAINPDHQAEAPPAPGLDSGQGILHHGGPAWSYREQTGRGQVDGGIRLAGQLPLIGVDSINDGVEQIGDAQLIAAESARDGSM